MVAIHVQYYLDNILSKEIKKLDMFSDDNENIARRIKETNSSCYWMMLEAHILQFQVFGIVPYYGEE